MKAVNEAQFESVHHQSLLLQSQQTWAKRFDRFDFISDLAAHWVIIVVHTHTQPFHVLWSGTSRVGRYQKKHSPTQTPSWSSDILYHLPPFTMIHNILFIQFTFLTVLFDNLSPGPLWSSSWSWTLYFMHRAFLHPVVIFSQHMPIPSQPVLLQYQCYV